MTLIKGSDLRGHVTLRASEAGVSTAPAASAAAAGCIGRVQVTAVLLRHHLHAAVDFRLAAAIITHLHNLHPHLSSKVCIGAHEKLHPLPELDACAACGLGTKHLLDNRCVNGKRHLDEFDSWEAYLAAHGGIVLHDFDLGIVLIFLFVRICAAHVAREASDKQVAEGSPCHDALLPVQV